MDKKTSPILREPTYFILLCLASNSQTSSSAKHGYAILKEVESLSMGRVRLSTSTLYEALARLLEQGWIKRVDEPEDKSDSLEQHPGKPRKGYRLAPPGRRALDAEINRLEALLSAARRQLVGRQSEGG